MKNQHVGLADLEEQLGRVLLAGISFSSICLAAGLVVFVASPDARVAAWLLNGGLILLMATPILRVLVSVIEYARMRDWFFVATTVAVLATLAVSVVYAYVGSRSP